MATTRRTRTTVLVALAGAALALTPSAAGATTTDTATVAASAPVTRFVTLKPWTSTGKLQVKVARYRSGDDLWCQPSRVTERKDAWACVVGDTIMDPSFKSPKAKHVAFRDQRGRWTVYRNVRTFQDFGGTPSGRAYPLEVRLTNGATCRMMTGAGPAPHSEKFPYWAGRCTGGPYGTGGAIWRATVDDGKNANYPLLALNAKRTKWAVAVEHPKGTVKFVPATSVLK